MIKSRWCGSGKFRCRREEDQFWVHFMQLTTRTARFQEDTARFFRKEARDLRPRFGPFDVRIWIEHIAPDPRIDVDNVAKACLDCLTKVVWMDDRQVKRLQVDKFQGTTDQVYVCARAMKDPPLGQDLLDHLESFS